MRERRPGCGVVGLAVAVVEPVCPLLEGFLGLASLAAGPAFGAKFAAR